MAENIKSEIKSIALKHNASSDWGTRLANGARIRSSPILTAELQDLWSKSNPILFIGTVSDVARDESGETRINIDYGDLDQAQMFLETQLRVSLLCKSSIAEPFLAAAKSATSASLHSNIAVIAEIYNIIPTTERTPEGEPTGVLTGTGRCIDAIHIDTPIYWWMADKIRANNN